MPSGWPGVVSSCVLPVKEPSTLGFAGVPPDQRMLRAANEGGWQEGGGSRAPPTPGSMGWPCTLSMF